MLKFKTSSPLDFVGTKGPATSPAKRKRNRGVERLHRQARDFQRRLYAKAAALHDEADSLRQDDEDARYNEEVQSTCIPRIRARQIEAIADTLFKAVCGK